ncbi:hypothetical protein [Lysobacter sp. Root690]|uniref:hypothetical protein n=1 Tax=Lysobacter sp. Root690 TaxID=1736588 RepID=UPI0006F7AE06|nr:hypothetical protein [Lysobacter sp. Root690]KRB04121.1 hypothetical protein ASD86_17425 [Lysobacter sp. Root690]
MSGYEVLIAADHAERVLAGLPELGWRLTDAAGRISGIDGEGDVQVLASADQARPFLDDGGLLIWHDGQGGQTLGVAFYWRQPGSLKLQLDGLDAAQRKLLLAGLERLLAADGSAAD